MDSGRRRFETAVPIGVGATAEVFERFDRDLGRRVAVKYLRSKDPEITQRLLREARAQATLHHRGICRIYDVQIEADKPHIVMELVEGQALDKLAGLLSQKQLVEVMRQVALALGSAHTAGLLHRDVTPANILVEDPAEDLRAVLVDFGLVREINAPAGTCHDQILGTPPYMAPEQVLGSDVDARTDIYGLGATFYEMLTGVAPFQADRRGELLVKISQEEVTSPRRRDRGIPIDLESIILRCLEKSPERRYSTTAELAEELHRFQTGSAILSRRPTVAARTLRIVRRHRLVSALLLALSLALVALIGNRWSNLQQVGYERELASLGDTIERRIERARASSSTNWPDLRAEVEGRLAPIEDRLNRSRSPAAAASHFLLGKSRALLSQPEPAVHHLSAAWAQGLRTPDISFYQGIALLQMLDQETWYHGTQEIPPELLDDLENRYLEPALEHLEQIDESDGAVFELAQALSAYYSGDKDEAIVQIARAGELFPTEFEIALFEGRLLHRVASEAWSTSDLARFQWALAAGQAAYRRVLPSLPGAVKAYEGLCNLNYAEVAVEISRKGEINSEAMAVALRPCQVAKQLDPESTVPQVIEAKLALMSAWALFGKTPEQAYRLVDRAQEIANSLSMSTPPTLSAFALQTELLRFQAPRPEYSSDPLQLIDRARRIVDSGRQLLDREPATAVVEKGLLEALLVLNQMSYDAALEFSETAAQAVELATKRLEARPGMTGRRYEMAQALISQYLAQGPPQNPDHLLQAREVLEAGQTDEPGGHYLEILQAEILLILADHFDPSTEAPERWLDPAEALYTKAAGNPTLAEHTSQGIAEVTLRRVRHSLATGTGGTEELDQLRLGIEGTESHGTNGIHRRLLEAEVAILDLQLAAEAGKPAPNERLQTQKIFERLLAEAGNTRPLLAAFRLAGWIAITAGTEDPTARAGLLRSSNRAAQAIKAAEQPATFLFGRGIISLLSAWVKGNDSASEELSLSGCVDIRQALRLEPQLLYEDPALLHRSIALAGADCALEATKP